MIYTLSIVSLIWPPVLCKQKILATAVTYDEKALEALLDRSQEGQAEKEFGMNDYLSSFKVASYQVKEEDEEEVRNGTLIKIIFIVQKSKIYLSTLLVFVILVKGIF